MGAPYLVLTFDKGITFSPELLVSVTLAAGNLAGHFDIEYCPVDTFDFTMGFLFRYSPTHPA
jgi:hypothetical protein